MPLLPTFLTLLWAPIHFDEAPPAGLHHKVEKVIVGKWSDGLRSHAVEEVTWLSPSTVAALGWNWSQARARFEGALVFSVRLSALERQDYLELGGDTAPGENVARAGITVTLEDGRKAAVPVPAEIILRWTQRTREPRDILRLSTLSFVFGEKPDRTPLNLGRNQIAIYEVRVPIDATVEAAARYRIRITTPRRTREAVFVRWPRISSSGR